MPAGQHQHGDGCMATNNAPATVATNNSAYNYGGNGGNYGTTQPQTNNYGGGSAYTAPTTAPYYDYSAGTNTSSTYTAPPVTGGYNANTSNGSYYDYVAPKAAPKATTNNTYRAMPQTSATSASTAGASGSYTVQKGDTVFQVMRNSGVYWKDIIRLNNLEAPNYPLIPGQRLKLK
jgi:LysM repeat protein